MSSGDPQDVPDRLFARFHQKVGAFDETRSQDIVAEVFGCFPFRADRKSLRHRTQPEAGNLGKDEPHPMTPFSAGGQFVDDLRIDVGLVIAKPFAMTDFGNKVREIIER